jgi:hypothetical protein
MSNEAEKQVDYTTGTGSCLCGRVTFEADHPPDSLLHCHCWMCRKQHGAAFATWAFYPADRFRLLTGADALQSYHSSENVRRTFCRECGSSLFFTSPDFPEPPTSLWVAAGTFDGDLDRAPDAHIFVSCKASWYAISDGLPQSDE